MPLSIESVPAAGHPEVAVLALAGELDASNYETLVDRVRSAYADGARKLVLDMSALTFMASSGLVALYSAVRIMRGEAPPDPEAGWGAIHDMEEDHGASGDVRLAGPPSPVYRVLDRTGLIRLFQIDETVAASLAAFGAG
jgi:stage II sporulation protein AA (anti-sigma F factor antagonist)